MESNIITYKCKLILTPEQHKALWDTCYYYYNFYYNWILNNYCQDKSIKTKVDLHHQVYYPIRNACPELSSDYEHIDRLKSLLEEK